MNEKPMIGITGYHILEEEGQGGNIRGLPGQGFSLIGQDYITAVERAGGISIGVPVGHEKNISYLLNKLDGLILSGGEDIDPAQYGKRPDMNCWMIRPERDNYELALIKEALQQKIPVLAICRGMQLFNIYFGGTLFKDISDRQEETLCHQFNKAPRWYIAHKTQLSNPLNNIFKKQEIETNSYHHQMIDKLGNELQISAKAEDGVIEGIYHPEFPNVMAIQWHPETMATKFEDGLIPFKWLVEQALANIKKNNLTTINKVVSK